LSESESKHVTSSISDTLLLPFQKNSIRKTMRELKARGGKNELRMFLTGPAGAGKTTAVKVSQKFCSEFCRSSGMMFSDNTFFFTAYTGSAASMCGGRTILKAAQVPAKGSLGPLKKETQKLWKDVKILIIDEISFMNDQQLHKLDQRLKELNDCNKPFGGFSVIFSGDFRQLQPGNGSNKSLIYSSQSSGLFEQSLNAILILNNEHRFKDDPRYGQMLKRMWFGDLSLEDRKWINSRTVHGKNVKLPNRLEGESCYACPTNVERNTIHARIFERHILATHHKPSR
jgi:ATP-dependent DNA helicase PIF1